MNTLYFISLALFVAYNVAVLLKFGSPQSLSETYYLFKVGRWLFYVWSLAVTFTLMPVWFYKLIDEPVYLQVLALLGCFSLVFVTSAGDFKSKVQEKPHYIFAGICALFSQAVLLLTDWRSIFLMLFVFVVCWILGGISGTIRNKSGVLSKSKNSLVYWLEMACFVNVYVGLWIF